MGDEDEAGPRDRAEADAELASQEFAAAGGMSNSAAGLDAMSQNLAQMGYAEMADVVGKAATHEHAEAVTDAVHGQHYLNAAQTWSTVANDLDQAVQDRGHAYAGAAERMVALEPSLTRPLRAEETAHAESIGHHMHELRLEANALLHDATIGAPFAIDEERRARGTYHPPKERTTSETPGPDPDAE